MTVFSFFGGLVRRVITLALFAGLGGVAGALLSNAQEAAGEPRYLDLSAHGCLE